MNDYIIWLKSGECISGTAKEEIIRQLQEQFVNSHIDERISFSDADGIVVVDLNQVEAIAVNKQPAINKVGF